MNLSRSILLGLLPLVSWAQISYVAQKTTSLSSAAEVVTVQQPNSGSRFVELKSAYIDCSSTCTVTLERNGTPATATTLTPANVNPGEGAAAATAWSGSNSSGGTVIQVATIQAGGYLVFDLTTPSVNLKLNRGNGENFTLRTSSISATVHITINWTERTN